MATKYVYLFLITSLAGFQLATPAPMDERGEFFANIDYNQVVGHMKELMMYLPVLMTTVKETMTGFPKVSEGINSLGSRRFLLGSGRHNDGKCRCKQVKANGKRKDEDDDDDEGYR